jgi:hypothetical protein
MHPILIKANIALFKGDRLEAQRLLDDYYSHHKDQRNTPEVLWLDAQTRPTREDRLQQLEYLTQTLPPDNPYHRIARQHLKDEADYAAKLYPPPRFWQRRILGLAAWIWLLLFIGGVFAASVLNTVINPAPAPIPLATEIIVTQPTRTPLPDMSSTLAPENHALRFDAGILQILAVEDASQRVVLASTNALIEPVPGARFYALRVVFECRLAVCERPPEADLALRVDDRFVINARADVRIENTAPLESIALGRAASGWVIFEIPAAGQVSYLQIIPYGAPRDSVAPVILIQP